MMLAQGAQVDSIPTDGEITALVPAPAVVLSYQSSKETRASHLGRREEDITGEGLGWGLPAGNTGGRGLELDLRGSQVLGPVKGQ